MANAFLDSSVLIGIVFRNAGERAACYAALPSDGVPVCSRYVIFEVARGFLRSLIALHNYSFEFNSFADLHQAAHSGQKRFQPYAMHTWLGAFDDYFAALEKKSGGSSESLKLEELRAKLRGWIRRGWRQMETGFTVINVIGCRDFLPPPSSRGDQRIDQKLPDGECGQPDACQLQAFIKMKADKVEEVAAGLRSIPAEQQDNETKNRIKALDYLGGIVSGAKFDGKKCHRCGDALICLEAPANSVIATKNGKHFKPLTLILGKRLVVAQTAINTGLDP